MMEISRNTIVRTNTAISVPETFIGKISENKILDAITAIEVRSKKVDSITTFIDSINDLSLAEKAKLREITQELNSTDEEPQTLLSNVKRKITAYASEIENQWLVPLMITQLDKFFF